MRIILITKVFVTSVLIAMATLFLSSCESLRDKATTVQEFGDLKTIGLSGTIAYLGYKEGFWQVFISDVEGQRQITNSPYDKSRLSWFPDGKHFLVNANDGRLFKVNIESGAESEIRTRITGMMDAMVSPDGKRIVFSLSTADSIDGNDLWIMNSDGTHLEKLTKLKWLQHEPAWSPDGEWVYFLSGRGGQTHDIWRVSINDRRTEQLTVGSLYHFDVSVSTNGRMAYSSNRSGDYEIWTQKINASPHKLTDSEALDARPDWSADGRWIAYESAQDGVINIWIMDSDGKHPKRLTNNDVGARFPVWKPETGK